MLLLLLACARPDDSAEKPSPDAPDLTERLGTGEVRAGVVVDAASLIGGVSAEGALGDVLLYNDRARFLIQKPGESSYYVEYGGQLVDADIVRAPGAPGRDLLDESSPMVGLGRVVDVETVTVISDGSDGEAIVRTEGRAAPMQLLTGALENPSVVPDLALRVRTDYALAPDTWSIRVTTTVWSEEDAAVPIQIGELALVAMDVAEGWRPGTGRAEGDDAPAEWSAAVAHGNEGVVALLSDDAPLETGTVGRILGSMAPAITGFSPAIVLDPGGSASWTRWIGVGPDLATLTGEQLARSGAASTEASGTVTAGGAPVAGARVFALDASGAPLTMAVTGSDGAWSARVPAETATWVAAGRGRSLQVDLPAGAGWISPYEHDQAATLTSLAEGANPISFAEGYGVSAAGTSTDLALTAPGTLDVAIADGGPAIIRVYFSEADAAVVDERLVPGRPSGLAAVGFVRDGELSLALEPGTYEVVAHRGVRDEYVRESVTIESGVSRPFTADIQPAYTLDGVFTIDPHSHASPSGDGGIPMSERLIVAAANGVDVHVGTDHDHVADYRPLLAPLGLEGRLRSVVADEVSPVLRGHFNVWPATQGDGPNHGAPQWWLGYADTAEIFGWLRALAGEDGVVQANHPVGDSGMFSFAEYDANGHVSRADAWSADFDAMELINSGDWADNFPYYLDLVRRGKLVTPVSVSDSHAHMSGAVGLNVTFLHTGGDFATLDDDALKSAMARQATVASFGPYIDATVGGAWAPGAVVGPGSTLEVVVRAPSWIPVETVSLYRDGTLVLTETCTGTAPAPCTASFALDSDADASYVVVAASTTAVTEWVHPGNLAWAATAATLLDVDGDGWEAPMAPIEVEE